MTNYNIVKANKIKSKISASSVSVTCALLKVKPAKFVRPVILVPTKRAEEIPDLKFDNICISIPSNEKCVKFHIR